jgi:hypothetical protein
LQVTGEYGVDVFHRLGLQNQCTDQEMSNIALKRMQYWQSRATDYLGTDGNSIAASSILARSYERILYQIRAKI